MGKYVIFTDSCCDISEQMSQDINVRVIPLKFIMDNVTYAFTLDEKEMKTKDFYRLLREGKQSTTAQINTEEFIAAFEPVLEEGLDVLYIAFSSGLSGTCQSAGIAARELNEKYPDRKVVIQDSLAASMGHGLLVYLTAKKRDEGLGLEELVAYLSDITPKLAHWFTVDDLNHLKRGGRVSAGAALVGTMLSIKPVLHVDDEGHLIPVSKVRGRKSSLDALVSKMEETAVDPADQTVFISHGDCIEDAKYVENEIRRRLGTKNFYINFIGPVIGAHSGPGTVALFFLASHK